MRKKLIVNMYNEAVDKLYEIKKGLIRHVESNGGVWIDHGTDDNDRTCYHYRGNIVGICSQSWDIDGRRVTFGAFLAKITRDTTRGM